MKKIKNSAGRILSLILTFAMIITVLPVGSVVNATGRDSSSYYIFFADQFSNPVDGAEVKITATIIDENDSAYLTDGENEINDYSLGITDLSGRVSCDAIYDYANEQINNSQEFCLQIDLEISADGYVVDEQLLSYELRDLTSKTIELTECMPVKSCTAYEGVFDDEEHDVINIEYADDYEPDGEEVVSYDVKYKDISEEITCLNLDKIKTVSQASNIEYLVVTISKDGYADFKSEELVPKITPVNVDENDYQVVFLDRPYQISDGDSVSMVVEVKDCNGNDVDGEKISYRIKDDDLTYYESPKFSVTQFLSDDVVELAQEITVIITLDENHNPIEYTSTARLKRGDLPEFTFSYYGDENVDDDENTYYSAVYDTYSHSLLNGVSVENEESADNYSYSYKINGEDTEDINVTNTGVYNLSITVSHAGFTPRTYTGLIVISPADIDGVSVVPAEVDYLEDENFLPVSQPLFDWQTRFQAEDFGSYLLEYSQLLAEDEVNTIVENGTESSLEYSAEVPMAENVGTYYFFVKVQKLNGEEIDENYNTAYFSTSTNIKAKIIDFTSEIHDHELTFNDTDQPIANLENVVRENIVDEEGIVLYKDEYSFQILNENYELVETVTNEIPTVKSAGVYHYIFTLERENFDKVEIPFTVTVNPCELKVEDISKTENIVVNVNNVFDANITNMIEKIVTSDDSVVYFSKNEGINRLHELGDIRYTVSSQNTKTPARINGNGVITYYGEDKIVVRVTISATNDCKELTFEYTVNVNYNNTKVSPKVSGTAGTQTDDTQWYRTTVTISPDTKGWKIRECDSEFKNIITSTASWTENVKKSNEAEYNLCVVFVNESGEICKPVKMSSFSIDKTKPNSAEFVLTESDIVTQVSFGCFSNKTINVKVKGSDANSTFNSGVDSLIFYSKTESGKVSKSASTTAVKSSADFSLKNPFSGTIGVYITDKAGNKSPLIRATTSNSNIANTNAYIMIEKNPPTISDVNFVVDANASTYETSSKNVVYTSDPVLNFKLSDSTKSVDENSGIAQVKVSINGEIVYNESYKSSKRTLISYSLSCSSVSPDKNGAYKCKITAIDNAGNQVDSKDYIAYKDTTVPVITGFEFDGGHQDSDASVTSRVESTNYGFYFKDDVKVTVTALDIAGANEYSAGVRSITYKAVDIDGGTVVEGTNNTDYQTTFVVPKNFKGQIYAYATDNLGLSSFDSVSETGYDHPDGSIIENLDKHYESSSIIITVPIANGRENRILSYGYNGDGVMDKEMAYNTSQNVPLYSSNPVFAVTANDTYSGIRSVRWTYIEGNTVVATSIVTVDNNGNISNTDGWETLAEDNNLVISIGTNVTINGNSNDSTLLVELEDRAGNVSYDYYSFGIDKTKPVIEVTYDNNTADSQNKSFYNKGRRATIVVTERNFDPNKVDLDITNSDGTAPKISSWVESAGSTPDNTKYTATIDFTSDGDYTFAMSYVDNAGIKADDIKKQEFTIDTILPVVTVEYDNNSVSNDKYFKAIRTATVTVTEHNFDVKRANLVIGSTLEGKALSVPKITWRDNGDVHTAEIVYEQDADYTFSVDVTDMASNKSSEADFMKSKAGKDFVVDTIINSPVIGGVENQYAYKSDVAPFVEYEDVNFNEYSFTLTRTRRDEKDKDVSTVYKNEIKNNENGGTQVFENFEEIEDNDGIYKLTAYITDRAGNKSDEAVVIFSVNRFGSVFVYSSYITDTLVANQYVQEVEQALVITEYNPDKILADDVHNVIVTRDGAGVTGDVETSPEISEDVNVGDSGWYQYNYTIPTSMFSNDGFYSVTVTSKDSAQNISDSSIHNPITFNVDSVKPELTNVSGLENTTYNAQSIKVDFEAFDVVAIKSVTIKVDGKEVKKIVDIEDLNKCKNSFEIGEGINQTVTIEIEDMASNKLSTDDSDFTCAYTFEKTVTVSTNFFVRWFANKILFFASIIGAVAMVAFVVVLLLRRKRVR